MKITVYKVKAGGSVKYVDKTREGALLWATTSLKEIWGDIPYRILSETLDVPETTGVIWSDKETAHVDWRCPHCGESHFTDLDTDESPALWLCETGNKDDLCLVHFDKRALHDLRVRKTEAENHQVNSSENNSSENTGQETTDPFK